jgi:hypothetical protein
MTTYYTRQIAGGFQAGSTVRAASVNSELDALVTGLGTVTTDINRAIKLPSGADIELTENAASRANKVVAADSAGDVVWSAIGDLSAVIDVVTASLANGDILVYDSTDLRWENRTLAAQNIMSTDAAQTMAASINMADNALTRGVFKDGAETAYNLGTFSSGTLAIDHEDGHYQYVTLAGNVGTQTFSNWPATGTVGYITLEITQDGTGSRTVSWASSVDWQDAAAPTLSTGAADVDILMFWTRDGGTTVHGSVVSLNSSS